MAALGGDIKTFPTLRVSYMYWLYPIALRTAKTLWSSGRSECSRVKARQRQTMLAVSVSGICLDIFFSHLFSLSGKRSPGSSMGSMA